MSEGSASSEADTKLPALERFRLSAEALGIDVAAVRYPEGTRTAADAATAIGCGVDQIVKSLVLVGPDGPLLALTAGHHRVSLDAVAAVVGGPVRMSDADTARAATGFSIGGTPPFGHTTRLRTLLDPSLLEHEVVYGAAGTPDTCFPVPPEVLAEVTEAEIVEFAELG